MVSLTYLVRRVVGAIGLLLTAAFVTLVVLHMAPGDPAQILLGETATQQQVAELRTALGLDLPLPVQYTRFIARALRGDLGDSLRYRRPALEVVLERLPATIELTAAGFVLAVAFGIPLGVIGGVRSRSRADRMILVGATVAQSMPGFWLGALLVVIFSIKLGLLPTSGRGGVSHLVLPAITLATAYIGLAIRMTRQSMKDVVEADYVRTARAKGLKEWRVLSKHALRNALIPVVTVLALQLGRLVGGAVVTEGVFAWPGVGSAAIIAIHNRDYPVVQAVVLVTASAIVVTNLIVDLAYRILDPRIRVV